MTRFEAIMKALKNFGKPNTDETAEDAERASEELNQMLPGEVSGRGAILTQREKFRKLDKMLEDAR